MVLPTRTGGRYFAPGDENSPGPRDACSNPEDYLGRVSPTGTLAHGVLNQGFLHDEEKCVCSSASQRGNETMAETGQHSQPIDLTDFFSANFVIPYPPGLPITASGQVITERAITFMRKLAVNEIHCCHTAQGLKLLKPAQRAACTTA